ncbi:MAG: tryptophan synthase subunit alpha [Terrimicrobiaceae bacterium]|nr:tryptophan synthase subunit alpha [Terrimicrobiaceae bacterium]
MNRIDACFDRLKSEGRSGFIAYLTGGDPSLDATVDLMLALERAGADIVELGVPFSDPLADGPTIQAASGRALAAGATTRGVLDCVRRVRERSQLPLVLFTYLNPVYAWGFERFHADAAAAGADGVLLLDLPPDETGTDGEFRGTAGLRSIRLIAPTTPPGRIGQLAASAEGFIYYVSREGVTGEQAALSDSIGAQVAEIRRHTALPIAVGFGISTPEQAAGVAKDADAVVVGSAIVRRIGEHGAAPDLPARIEAFVRPLAEAAHARAPSLRAREVRR